MTKITVNFDSELTVEDTSAICNDVLYESLLEAFKHGMSACWRAGQGEEGKFAEATWWLSHLKYKISLVRPIFVAIVGLGGNEYEISEARKFGDSLVDRLTRSIKEVNENLTVE